MGDDAPTDPGYRSRQDQGWQFAWGGDWQATPAPPLGDTTRYAISACSEQLPDGIGDRLQGVLATEGSQFILGSVGETIMIYSPVNALAARIRYGD